jgi:anti-anti-sigma factor
MTILTFTGNRIHDEGNMIAKELGGLPEEITQRPLLLDFRNVQDIRGTELATLVLLHRRMSASGGRLTLCGLDPLLKEVLAITRLDTFLDVREEERHSTEELTPKSVPHGIDWPPTIPVGSRRHSRLAGR